MTTNQIAVRLLELQHEFAASKDAATFADAAGVSSVARPVAEIGADYADTLAAFLAQQGEPVSE